MLFRAAALATLLAQVPLSESESDLLLQVPPQAPSTAQVTLQLYVRQVTPSAGLDLPPLDQKPAVYAELTLDNQRRTTAAIAPERIGDSIYPNWGLSARRDAPRLEPGHPVQVIIRTFDQDSELDDIVDDKVVLTAIQFDPFACEASVNAFDLAGRWQDDVTCVLPIDRVESETGSLSLVLAARWDNAAPGASPSDDAPEE
ncbi:MAG: hypothetical protein WBA10_20985 [Elainellaceae cyanobacterium]